jgi:hypothetical protein
MATHSFDLTKLTKEDAMDSAITCPSLIPEAQPLSEKQEQKLTSLAQRMEMLLKRCFGEDDEMIVHALRGL